MPRLVFDTATLYGAARVSYCIARDGELPAELERKVWVQPVEGLLITAGLTLFAADVFDLTSISTLGSAGFLLIFAAVNIANARHAQRDYFGAHTYERNDAKGTYQCVVRNWHR